MNCIKNIPFVCVFTDCLFHSHGGVQQGAVVVKGEYKPKSAEAQNVFVP